jgi:hypothetical protein
MSNLTGERGTTTLPKTSYKTDKQTKTKDDSVKYVVDSFNRSWKYAQSNYHTRWENSHSLYSNRRVKRGYDGVSDVFVPMVFSTVETMVSALAGGKPQFDYLPPQDRPDQNTEILNALLDYFWDKDQWNIKVQNLIRSMLTFGTGVGYLMWDIDHPVMVNVPLRDFFFDPNAINLENAPVDFYCGRRYLTTKAELESFEIVDPETGETKPKYMNLDQIQMGKSNKGGDETDKEKKDLFYGSTAPDPESTQVEVLELWTEDKVCSVANRSVLIEEAENPYKTQHKKQLAMRDQPDTQAKGIIPFIIQRDYVDESLFYGSGEVEKIADLQELLNDNRNQRQDYISYILNPMFTLNPMKADMIEQIESMPGRVFPLDANDLQPVVMPNLPNEAFNNDQEIKNDIRETTASNEVVKGMSSDQQTTATEINAQVAQAGQRLGMKVTQIENESFHRLARIVFEMVKLYVNDPLMVRIVGKDGVKWEMFDPEQFQGDYEPRVQLDSSVKATKNEDVMKAKEIYLSLSGDPTINQDELKKVMLPKMFDLDPDEVDRILTPPEPPAGMDEMGAEMGGEMPMEAPVDMPPIPDDLTPEEMMMLEQATQ